MMTKKEEKMMIILIPLLQLSSLSLSLKSHSVSSHDLTHTVVTHEGLQHQGEPLHFIGLSLGVGSGESAKLTHQFSIQKPSVEI